MNNTAELIQIKSLSKFYKKFKALDNVNLTLTKGKITGLLGKNGAGKSTLMKCVLGILKHEGEVYLNNQIVSHNNANIFQDVAFIPDVNEIDERLTVEQTINYIKGDHPKWSEERSQKLLKLSNLPLKNKVKSLSKGMKTKLYLLITLSLDVSILLLDEPTIGLDIAFKKEFYDYILGEYFDENKIILISTHQIEEIEHLLQEIIILHEGKLVLHKDLETLKSEYHNVSLPQERKDELDAYNPLYKGRSLGVITGLFNSEVKIEGASYSRPQISEIFLALTGGYHATI
jgi:ABC-2 type transport system ATP-binding protein